MFSQNLQSNRKERTWSKITIIQVENKCHELWGDCFWPETKGRENASERYCTNQTSVMQEHSRWKKQQEEKFKGGKAWVPMPHAEKRVSPSGGIMKGGVGIRLEFDL